MGAKQIIFYGPPGTGKTYLARSWPAILPTRCGQAGPVPPFLHLRGLFRGVPTAQGGSGTLTFRCGRTVPGFCRGRYADKSTAYILIIDEINRANLAKVFGELYFLLEYRNEPIKLQYSPGKPFTLPENLFIIGTMNTADRSIARIDSAMRRRFKFVELHPRTPPVEGLLARWLTRQGLKEWPARLLDELNARIEDADAAIGPSYLMDPRIYQRADGMERVWRYSIMPLLTDLFYGQRDLVEQYWPAQAFARP